MFVLISSPSSFSGWQRAFTGSGKARLAIFLLITCAHLLTSPGCLAEDFKNHLSKFEDSVWIRWVNIKQGDQQACFSGHRPLRYFEMWERSGRARAPRMTGVLFVLLSGCCSWVAIYGWCLFWWLLNIQAIFSILGCIPCIWETTVLDYHWPHHKKNNTPSLCSSQFQRKWCGSVCQFLGLAGPWPKFLYAFIRDKAIVHNWFQPRILVDWSPFSGFAGVGCYKRFVISILLGLQQNFDISTSSIVLFLIYLWNSLPKHGCKIIIFRSIIVLVLLNTLGHCNWGLWKAFMDEVYFSTVNDELLYILKLNSWNVEWVV